MKSSAWYHKLWRKKLEELPYQGNAGKAWSEMNKLLDQHLPAGHVVPGGGKIVKPFASKIVSLLSFILPAAAMIGAIGYFAVKSQHAKPINKKQPAAIAKSTVNKNANKYNLADSATALISLQSDDSLSPIPQVNNRSRADSSNNYAKNSNGHPSTQLLPIAPPLTLNDSNGKVISDPRKDKTSKTAAQRAAATLLLTKGAQPKVLRITPTGHIFAHVQSTVISNNRTIVNAGINLNKQQRTKRTSSTKLTLKGNVITDPVTKPNRNKKVVAGRRQEDSKDEALIASQTITVKDNDLTNKKTGIATINQAEGSDSPTGGHDNQADKEKITGGNNGRKGSTPDQKSTNQRKPVKSKGSSIFNSLFGKRNVNNSRLAYGSGFNYGITAGYSTGNFNSNVYLGAYASFEINPRWFVSPGLRLNTARIVSGGYSHDSYFRPDSIAPFTVTDSRKVYLLDVPLNVGYKLSKTVSLKAGPVFSFPIKQSAVISKVANVPDVRDTMMHTQAINTALSRTALTPKFNIGVSAGIGIQVRRFNIEAKYQQSFTPYKVSSDLGSYKFNSHSLTFGIGFQLNKGR